MIFFIILIILAIYFFTTNNFFFSFLLFTLALLSLVTETKQEPEKTTGKTEENFQPSQPGGEKVVAENLAGFINFIMHFIGRVIKTVFKPLEKKEEKK